MPALVLQSFRMKRLHLDSEPVKPFTELGKSEMSFSWAAAVDKTDPLNRILTFGMKVLTASTESSKSIPSMDIMIDGKFRIAGDVPEDKLEEVLLINGSTILYGVLRGLLAGLSGAFANGQLMLPTLDMGEIVTDMLYDRKSKQKAKTPKPASIVKDVNKVNPAKKAALPKRSGKNG